MILGSRLEEKKQRSVGYSTASGRRESTNGLLESAYNDTTIGSYNDYHLSQNDIPSGNQRWYGLVYLVYK